MVLKNDFIMQMRLNFLVMAEIVLYTTFHVFMKEIYQTGPYRAVQARLSPYRLVQAHTGLYRPILAHTSSPGVIAELPLQSRKI
jgi:hypothetical protein